jgi:hypothetical protein
MKGFHVLATLLILVSLSCSCSRKAPQTDPSLPEVIVTTVTPQDVPRVLERVATLDGFINANINAQVQGYIVARDYTEGSIVKVGDLLAATAIATFLIPVTFYVIERLFAGRKEEAGQQVSQSPSQPEPAIDA